ncbi:MAG: hypothetical protein F6J95_033480 [Leptolyngbya sp. SIO1E4]|nr:hypothetical protein [Leptolyngbya sp. SIO1E4]
MTGKKRMGNLSLSSFGGVSRPLEREETEVVETKALESSFEPQALPQEAAPQGEPKTKAKKRRKETLTTINIKIERKQQRWLQDTAQQVRDNNETAVPPNERVYPQHLIGAAIELLKAQDLDWEAIHSIEELKEALSL